jgi:uncharacterized protein (TIRG00374 family)
MYLTNMAIPRSGEVVRTGLINRYEKIPFAKLLGTIFTERIIDVLVLLLLAIMIFFTQFSVISDFINNNPNITVHFNNNYEKYKLLVIIGAISGVLFLLFLYFLRNKLKTFRIVQKIIEVLKNFWAGIKTVAQLKNRWAFIGHTIVIWVMYFLMLYLCFFSFEFTKDLNPMVGLTVLVIASFGMVIPSPGGMGTWHFLAIETLFIYGIAKSDGGIFAIAAHESQTIALIVFGLISFILLPIINNVTTSKEIETSASEVTIK